MPRLREKLSNIWDSLNPSEPSPEYLFKFLGFALLAFAIAGLIGGLLN